VRKGNLGKKIRGKDAFNKDAKKWQRKRGYLKKIVRIAVHTLTNLGSVLGKSEAASEATKGHRRS